MFNRLVKAAPWRSWGTAIFLSAACALLAWIALPAALVSSDCRDLRVDEHSAPGEALLHRVEPSFPMEAADQMPLTSLWAAQACRQGGTAGFKLLTAVSVAAPALLVLILGCLIASPPAALAALALSICVSWDKNFTLQWLYAGFVLLAACALAWRARAPSLRRTVVAALAIGAGLLFRSPLAFFPPVLVLYECIRAHRGALKAHWKHAIVLLLVPYIFLIPWTAMNWADQHRFIPLEHGEADCNVVAGALGAEIAIRGDCRSLIGDPNQRESGGILLWSAAEVLGSPWRYAGSCARRVALVARQQPLLLMAALLVSWLLRRRPEAAVLALLSAYFLFIHCLLAIQTHYFIPLWPLLALLSACGLGALAGRPPPRPDCASYRWAARGLGGAVILALLLSAYALAAVGAYWREAAQGALNSDAALERALGRSPADDWLLCERGRRSLGRGMTAEALPDLAKALSLRPGPECFLDFARALAAKGLPGPLLSLPLPFYLTSQRLRMRAARAFAYTERADAMRARDELALARGELLPSTAGDLFKSRTLSRAELAAIATMSGEVYRGLSDLLQAELILRPPARRKALAKELRSVFPAYTPTSLEPASSGSARNERGIDYWLAAAKARQDAGRPNEALAALAQAETMEPSPAVRIHLAGMYRELGQYRRAAALLDGLPARSADDPALWWQRARLAAARADKTSALSALARREALFNRLSPDDPELWREQTETALLYQDLKDYRRALALWDRLASENPRQAAILSDRGICHYLDGSTPQALADLNAAIRLDPGYLAAYMTLGAIDERENRPADALAVYDAALAGSKPGASALREAVEKSRARLSK